jgi:hypothetical protein
MVLCKGFIDQQLFFFCGVITLIDYRELDSDLSQRNIRGISSHPFGKENYGASLLSGNQ